MVDWMTTILKDPFVKENLKYIVFHWYNVEGRAFEQISKMHEIFPQAILFPSEATYTGGVKLLDWRRGELYGEDILGDLENWAAGWTDWNIILDENGGYNWVGNECDAPIIGNIKEQKLHYQITYYYLGHFSRFIPRGSVRIGLERNVPEKVFSTAFLTPEKKIVFIIINSSGLDVQFSLKYKGFSAETKIEARAIKTLTWDQF